VHQTITILLVMLQSPRYYLITAALSNLRGARSTIEVANIRKLLLKFKTNALILYERLLIQFYKITHVKQNTTPLV